MRTYRVLLAALAMAAAAPAAVSAQDVQVFRYTSRGMLGIMTEGVPPGTLNARQRVVVDVVPGSPAERAGIMKGDTILRINGLAATSQVMSAPFEPGDSVTLRVKRGSAEREVTVVATERSNQFEMALNDSIGRRMSVILETMRGHVDSILPRMTIRRFANDSTTALIIGTDTVTIIGPDGRIRAGGHWVSPDSLHRGLMLHMDSLRLFGDSARIDILRAMPRGFTWSDSVPFGEGAYFRVFGDTVRGVRPFEIMTAGTVIGMRAVAGAELSELNEGLGEYFGTSSGVLVINARPGTPAERAGLRAGDVIVRANGEPVGGIVELRRRIDAARGGTVELRVLRRGQNVDITLNR